MGRLALLAICILQIAVAVRGVGRYSIIAPGTIHSTYEYSAAVAVYNTTEPSQFKIGLTGPSYNKTETITLQPNEVQTVHFKLPKLENGNYNLTAEGVSGIIFTNTTKLTLDNIEGHVQIQIDKGVYKPGDVVNFRVLFLDKYLKPMNVKNETVIYFLDENGNRIKEYRGIHVVKGVYTNHLELSEHAMQGQWQIVVERESNDVTDKKFRVAKYVLPKFEVKVEATKKVAVQEGDVTVHVKALYHYGQPVNGKVTVVVLLDSIFFYENPDAPNRTPPTIIKTTEIINGKAKLQVNVKQLEHYIPYKNSPASLRITATVEESFTEIKANGSTTAILFPYRYNVDCEPARSCQKFDADVPTDVKLRFTHVDGSYLNDTKSLVKLIFSEFIRPRNQIMTKIKRQQTLTTATSETLKRFIYEGYMNASGIVTFVVTLPELTRVRDAYHLYELEIEYQNEIHHLSSILFVRPAKDPEPENLPPPPENYFEIELSGLDSRLRAKLGQKLDFIFNSSRPLPYVVYHIIGRSNILESGRIELPNKPKEYTMSYIPTYLTCPKGKIYVHYVDENGRFHFAENNFHVDFELQNKLEITVPHEVRPGTDVSLNITTSPNSFVGLIATDMSVNQLMVQNNFNLRSFNWLLNKFETYTPWQGGYSPYPGDITGMVTLTNADYLYNRTAPFPAGVMYEPGAESDFESDPSAADRAESGGHSNEEDITNNEIDEPKDGGIRVRSDFSETWIFADIENTETPTFNWTKKIPDTITSWMLTGFSIHPDLGIGLMNGSTNITTFQPFFISVRLPYSVKRGEVINVPALVFNYLSEDLDVQVVLDNTDGEYEFTDVPNEVLEEKTSMKSINVPANSAQAVSFMLRPTVVGTVVLKFTATSALAGDAVHKELRVVPEGVTEYVNLPEIIDLKEKNEIVSSIHLNLPPNTVPDSAYFEVSLMGDLLGPIFGNMESLLRISTSCAEQTTSKLVPNFLVMYYLKATKKLTPVLERKILRNMETGYQHILGFRAPDGSYMAFIPDATDRSKKKMSRKKDKGSTWLTAYVTRSLYYTSQFVNVDQKIIKNGLDYLAGKQAKNGSFLESGTPFYASQNNLLTLTSTALLAFIDNPLGSKYQKNKERGFKFILDNIDNTTNTRAKAIATYTLVRGNHPEARGHVSKLMHLAKSDSNHMWWSEYDRRPKSWWRWSYSSEVETTAYALLTLLELGAVADHSPRLLPIVKWLVAQRNDRGGFASSQDTVVGLQALINFAAKSGYEMADMTLHITSKGNQEYSNSIQIHKDNTLLLQSQELKPSTKSVNLRFVGTGTALFQFSYHYNVIEHNPMPSFVINTTISKSTPPSRLEVNVCVEYVDKSGHASNMAVMEVSLPSGYVADESNFAGILDVEQVGHVETKNSNSIIIVYFASLQKRAPQCLPVAAFREFAVGLQKPVPVVVFDYYDTSKRATVYYQVSANLCDICENDGNCKKECKKRRNRN